VGIELGIFCMASRGLNVNTARFILGMVNLRDIWQGILKANSRIVEKNLKIHNFYCYGLIT
jgi:hypothetical protein